MTNRINSMLLSTDQAVKFKPDDIYKAIADGLLSFDLYRDDISKTNRALVFRDETSLEFNRRIEDFTQDRPTLKCGAFWLDVGADVFYEGENYKVTLMGKSTAIMQHKNGTTELAIDAIRGLFDEGKITIRNASTPTNERCASAVLNILSPKQIDEALARARLLEQSKLSPGTVPVSKRTIQRLKKAVRNAGENAFDQNMALVSKVSARGNRERKISEELICLIHEVGKDVFNTPRAVTIKHAYQQFVARCAGLELRPCSGKMILPRYSRTQSDA